MRKVPLWWCDAFAIGTQHWCILSANAPANHRKYSWEITSRKSLCIKYVYLKGSPIVYFTLDNVTCKFFKSPQLLRLRIEKTGADCLVLHNWINYFIMKLLIIWIFFQDENKQLKLQNTNTWKLKQNRFYLDCFSALLRRRRRSELEIYSRSRIG